MNRAASRSSFLAAAGLAAVLMGVLTGCGTGQPSNSPRAKGGKLAKGVDDVMSPGRLLADCEKLKSGGSYSTREGSGGKEVSFYLERDGSTGSIRRLRDILASSDYTLDHKGAHAARTPLDGEDSLWLDLTQRGGAPVSLRVFSGTLFVVSDGRTDWHWSGGNSGMYFRILDALSPNVEEQHVERIEADAGAAGEGR
jgi:hypothetical protein